MITVSVRIQSVTPLLHHRMTEECLHGLLGAKSERKKDKEERTPRQIAEEHAYKSTSGEFTIPLSYVSGAFQSVASDYKQKNSQRKSYAAIAGGVFRPTAEWAVLTDHEGEPLKNFEVDIRKATNHQKGAIAVCRPRFDRWATEFSVELDNELLSEETAQKMLSDAGRRAGIGSFRVSKKGYFGQFMITKWKKIS